MTSFPTRLVAPLLALSALLLTGPAVFAHAQLAESDPLDGGTVTMPYTVVMRFDEELVPVESSIVVRDSGGNPVGEGGIVDDNFTMIAGLDALSVGSYTAHWVAITADDNGKTQGDVTFNVVSATASPTAAAATISVPSATSAAAGSPSAATPSPTVAVATAGPTVAPTATPGTTVPAQAAGAELIIPLVLGGAAVLALAWFFVRRRPN